MNSVSGAFAYPIDVQRLDGEVIVRCPDLPEVLTGADNEAEALVLAEDAIEEAILARLAAGRTVPVPPIESLEATDLVFVDPITGGRVLVEAKRQEAGLSKVQLADRMGCDEKIVRRILDGRSNVSMDTVMTALHALGHRATLAWN